VTPLAYDDLPEGSALRRDFDGHGGVTITAPAGEPSAAVRRAVARAALVPAAVASAACLLIVGGVVLRAARANRLDPSLRPAAWLTLVVLAGGVLLFVWLILHLRVSYAIGAARRWSSVLYADAGRLLIETGGPSGPQSVQIETREIASLTVASDQCVPCVILMMRNGSARRLLAGHHAAELAWAAAALSQAMRVPITRAIFRADLPFAGGVGG
jgi:hypothetical protein